MFSRNVSRKSKRVLAILLAVAFMFTTLPIMVMGETVGGAEGIEITNFAVVNGVDYIGEYAELSWNEAIDVDSYNIYRGTALNGDFSLLTNVSLSETSYIDRSVVVDTIYYYKIAAVKSDVVSKLTSGEGIVIKSPVGKFDFGAYNSDNVETGFTKISCQYNAVGDVTTYNPPTLTYGWDSTNFSVQSRDRGTDSIIVDGATVTDKLELFRDFGFTDGGKQFKVDLENGDYNVWISAGSPNTDSTAETSITVEGELKGTITSPKNSINTESYRVIVEDNTMDFEFDGNSNSKVNGIIITKITKAPDPLAPFHRVIIEAMNLPDTSRMQFVDEILENIVSIDDVDDVIINKVKNDYLTKISISDVEAALKEYAVIKVSNKIILKDIIDEGLVEIGNTTKFNSIAAKINHKLSGNSTDPDNKGLRFLVTLLKAVVGYTGPIAIDKPDDSGKIKFEMVNDNPDKEMLAKELISSLVDSVGSLKNEISTYDGTTNFDKLLNYCQMNINENPLAEVNAFKVLLKEFGIYNGTAIVGPYFNVNIPMDGEVELPFKGFFNPDTSNPVITLHDVESETNRIILNCKTSYNLNDGLVEVPFVLVLDRKPDSENTFEVNAQFVRKNETNRYVSSVDELNDTTPANGIPVYSLGMNTITVSHEYLDDMEETQAIDKSFQWENDEVINNQRPWAWADVAMNVWGIGPNSHIDLRIADFTGDIDNLSLDVKEVDYINYTPDGELLCELNNIENVTSEYVNNGFTIDENVGIFRFTYKDGDVNLLNEEEKHMQEVGLYINYYDNNNTLVNETDDLDFSEFIRQMTVDNQPIEYPYTEYRGTYDGTDQNLLDTDLVLVNLNDQIKANDIIANKDTYFTLYDSKGNQKAIPVSVDAYRDEFENDDIWEPYRKVMLYFDDIESGDIIAINGISDYAGNEQEEEYKSDIIIQRKINGTVKYSDGTAVPFANVEMVQVDSILGADFSSGKPDIMHRMLPTNQDGNFGDQWVDVGEYLVYRVSVPGDMPEDRGMYYLDETIIIEYSSEMDDAQVIDIVLPENNVVGKVTLDPEYPEDMMEIMVIKNDYLEGEWADFEDNFLIYEMFGKRAVVNAVTEDGNGDPLSEITEGDFELYLSPGDYTVIGKASGFSFIPPIPEYTFTVTGTGADLTNTPITFPSMNIVGKVVNSSGEAIEHAIIKIKGTDNEIKLSAMTNSDGLFATAAADGSYEINMIQVDGSSTTNTGLYAIDVAFDVVDGEIANITGGDFTSADDTNTLKNITLPTPNVNINITEAGAEVWGGQMELIFGEEMGGPWLWSENGQFDMYLAPGLYTIGTVGTHNMFIDEFDFKFNVAADGTLTDADGATLTNPLEIDLAANSNTIVTVIDETGELMENIGISVEGQNNGVWEWRDTNDSGKAYFDLPEGSYRIPGFHNPNTNNWEQIDRNFEVVDEDGQIEILIKITPPNVRGTVSSDSGSPVTNGRMDIKRFPSDGEWFPEFFGTDTDDEGNFSLNLREGEYLIEGIDDEGSWTELNFRFNVVKNEENLVMVVNGEIVDSLDVKKPDDNMHGFVYKNAENHLYDGRTNEIGYEENWGADIWLILRRSDVSQKAYDFAPWMYEQWVEVSSEDGSFGFIAEDNTTWQPVAVNNGGKWIHIGMTAVYVDDIQMTFDDVMVPDSNVSYVVIPPVPNFSGEIQDFNGTVVGPGRLNVERINDNGDIVDWKSMDIDNNGNFGMMLEPGSTYIIREASISDETAEEPWMNETRYTFNRKVIVGDDTSIGLILKPNTKGIIDIGGEINTGDDMYGGSFINVQIREILSENDSNYEDSQMNPWKYEQYPELTYNETTQKYEFYTYLKLGNYRLEGIPSYNGWIEIGEEFKVESASENTFNFNAVSNVNGVIWDEDGNPVDDAWVDIEKVDPNVNNNDQWYWNPDSYFGTNTSNDGTFSLKLNDSPENGYYRINGYNTKGSWQGRYWIQGERVQVNYLFKVVDGQLVKLDGTTPLTRIEIVPNVSGIFKQIYNQNEHEADDFINPQNEEYSTVKDVWLTIKPYKTDGDGNEYIDFADWSDSIWVSTNNTGKFNIMLGDGKYKVVDAGTYFSWFALDTTFEISDGLLVSNSNVVDGLLVVKPPRPNMIGKAYTDPDRTDPANWGGILVKPLDSKEYEWENSRWLETKNDGSFAGHLDVGEWKVVEISDYNSWQRVNIPLTVDESGNITSTLDNGQTNISKLIVQEDGSLIVSPKVPNIRGIVKDLQGNTLNKNAWITIKPADAGVYDWQNAVGVEYKNNNGQYMFQTRLPEGEYKVVDVGTWDFWYETNVRFNVDSNGDMVEVVDGTFTTITVNDQEMNVLTVAPPEANVNGTVYKGSDTSSDVLANGWMSMARFDENGKQLTMDGKTITSENGGWKSDYDEYYWMHTKWMGIDENGKFAINLDDGIYRIISVSGMDTWYEPSLEFKVVDGKLLDGSTLSITKPGPNVTVTIKNSNSTGGLAWIDIQDVENGFIFPVQSNRKEANGDFVFTMRLKDGAHAVIGFYGDEWLEIETDSFTVPNDREVVYDFGNSSKEKVTGKVYTTSGVAAGENNTVVIQKVENGQLVGNKKQIGTDSNGEFKFMLTPDEIWAIVLVADSSLNTHEYANPASTSNYLVTDTTENEQIGWNSIIIDTIQ